MDGDSKPRRWIHLHNLVGRVLRREQVRGGGGYHHFYQQHHHVDRRVSVCMCMEEPYAPQLLRPLFAYRSCCEHHTSHTRRGDPTDYYCRITWNVQTSAEMSALSAIVYADSPVNKYVAIASTCNPNCVQTSPDGVRGTLCYK